MMLAQTEDGDGRKAWLIAVALPDIQRAMLTGTTIDVETQESGGLHVRLMFGPSDEAMMAVLKEHTDIIGGS